MNLHLLGPDTDAATVERWERFVAHCPEATFFHRAGWRHVLASTFGHRPYFMYAEDAGEILGVLPMARQKSMIFGDALVSSPFCVYGGVAASSDAARRALEDAAVALGEQLRVDHVEFRNRVPRRADWERHTTNATFRKAIENDPERNLLAIPRKQRAEVRKGMERKLVAGPSGDGGMCWELYARSVHRHGTPVYAKRYFFDLKKAFGDDCEFFFASRDGKPVASLLNFYFRDEVLPYYAGSSGEGRDGEIHPYMYWALMNHAAARGARLFDFGRSPVDSGAYAFKKNFGFEPEPLSYEYRLVRAKHAPDADPKSPRYALMIDTWRKLPLWLANSIGPWAARQIG